MNLNLQYKLFSNLNFYTYNYQFPPPPFLAFSSSSLAGGFFGSEGLSLLNFVYIPANSLSFHTKTLSNSVLVIMTVSNFLSVSYF